MKLILIILGLIIQNLVSEMEIMSHGEEAEEVAPLAVEEVPQEDVTEGRTWIESVIVNQLNGVIHLTAKLGVLLVAADGGVATEALPEEPHPDLRKVKKEINYLS
jgi:hypothetical protein